MSKFRGDPEGDNLSAARDIERLVFASRQLMAPSEDLRPRTLELARARFGYRKQARQVGLLAMIAVCLWGVSFPAGRVIQSWHQRLVAPFSDEMLRSAEQYAQENPRQAEWGMVSVFTSLRGLKVAEQTPIRSNQAGEQ